MAQKQQHFRIFDFSAYDISMREDDEEDSDEESKPFVKRVDENEFKIQMFGINEKGETCAIKVTDYNPFFFIKVNKEWEKRHLMTFKDHLIGIIGKYYENSIVSLDLVDRKKLYGFDGGITHKFVKITFKNTICMNKVKNLWYEIKKVPKYTKKLLTLGYFYKDGPGTKYLEIYEGNIPPLLRYFHISQISPSGWINIKKGKPKQKGLKETHCKYEYELSKSNIEALNDKEERVPYKICSFDIEASSSHGDFPVPVKSYKKLSTNIIDAFGNLYDDITKVDSLKFKESIKNMIMAAFKPDEYYAEDIEQVFPLYMPKTSQLETMFNRFMDSTIKLNDGDSVDDSILTLERAFESFKENEEDENGEFTRSQTMEKETVNVEQIVKHKKFDRETKINYITILLGRQGHFPKLEGDKVTFIGSTFMKYGDSDPYKNTCIALGDCDNVNTENTEPIIVCETEKDVLLEWTKLIQKEDPDIIIGYNIFGFDYRFMFERAKENVCEEEFLKLSRNQDEICGKEKDGRWAIEETSIVIASGQHDLYYIKMEGRLQVDLYNYFRRDYNLTSYKLDYVAGNFIGDKVKSIINDESNNKTTIATKNMTGLLVGSYVNFEEIGHSSEYYQEGKKFIVSELHVDSFVIDGIAKPDMITKKVKWGLAKDDVSPQDIFRMTNEGPASKSVIAKYCIQDCNLVHYLMNKIDVITGFIEMAKICSVPMNFLVMRGQGIKLTSYIAKKCREKNTLMPDIEKGSGDEGYEGAIVLPPKSGLYLDTPVACVDYSSLYPSSMISENLSHDSKVWTKEYNLNEVLIKETGEKDSKTGKFIYDNLPEYEYVDVKYDTYKYVRKNPNAAAQKIISGYKICRFAQFPNNEKAIMPSILKELLAARKATRKMIPQQKDDFMKNILDKRQLSYKVTANSLYGQCGAKTSTFYEKDVAASTTATGRKLLTYGKRVIEEVYGDTICDTKNYGKVKSNAEYIYGDTDSVFFAFNLKDLDGNRIIGQKALEITIELAIEAGKMATKFLKAPHDLEYEKTFLPFALLSKKRYVGMLFEEDPNVGYRKEMGIVLKRRDNAPIVKDVYGGIIDILMKEQNVDSAVKFLKSSLQDIVDEKISRDKLIITKSLRSHYKNPNQIAHKVLADRIGKRDPGNKPSNGDRIPFIYIKNPNKKALQGEKIETPQFIQENKLKPDYAHYITNQIMKPVSQVFALPEVMEQLPGMKGKPLKIRQYKKEVEAIKSSLLEVPDSEYDEKYNKKLEALRNKYVKTLLFDKYITMADNTSSGVKTLASFF